MKGVVIMFYLKRNNDVKGLFDDLFDFSFPVIKSGALMRTDVKEEKDKYIFEVEMPGFTKEDIKISVENEYLEVEAKREFTKEDKDNKDYIIRERQYGEVKRAYYVGNVDEANIKANYIDGVLTINVPKAIQVEKKFIAIE